MSLIALKLLTICRVRGERVEVHHHKDCNHTSVQFQTNIYPKLKSLYNKPKFVYFNRKKSITKYNKVFIFISGGIFTP